MKKILVLTKNIINVRYIQNIIINVYSNLVFEGLFFYYVLI